jgi:CRISPR-associated protein Csh1
MIEALYEIGRIQGKENFLEEYIEDIGNGYKHVFKIIFNIDDSDNIRYREIGYEEFKENNKLKYMYKKGGARGSDSTPISKITQLSKTFDQKILGSVKSFAKNNASVIDDDEKKFLTNLNNCLNSNREKIVTDLLSLIKESMEILNEKEGIKDGGILTLTFEKENKILFIGELEIFGNAFIKQEKSAYKSFYYSKSRNEESRSYDRICYLCKNKKEEVWGLVGTFKFYTIDKPGMVAGGFNQENAWKNYPVCPDCAIILNRGKKYIEGKLKNRFCGFDYFVIPQLAITGKESLAKVLQRLEKAQEFTLSKEKAERIKKNEERVIEELSKEGNHINFNLIFFKEEHGGDRFNILLYLQEVSPTRFRKLIDAKETVDNMEKKSYKLFESFFRKNEEIRFDFGFWMIRNFFTNSREEGNFDKDFLAVVNQIFYGQQISYDFLLNRFMDKIRRYFLNDFPYNFQALRAYKILLYIQQINLLKRRRFKVSEKEKPYREFFEENSLFDEDTKRAIFLEGVLAEKLLIIQYRARNSKPFMSRLNGLKIDERVAKRLLPEMINKLEEYDKNFYKELEEAIGIYFLNSDFSKFSVDEISFYFTLGMTLANKLLPKKTNQTEEDINE